MAEEVRVVRTVSLRAAIVLLAVCLAVGILPLILFLDARAGYDSLAAENDFLQQEHSILNARYSSIQADHTGLEGRYNSLQSSYDDLSARYTSLQSRYISLEGDYQSLRQHAATPPCTLIRNGSVEWRFYDLSGSVLDWTMPIDTYRYYVNLPKTTTLLSLHSDRLNKDFKVPDLRPYIDPSFFSKVIPKLTSVSTDKDFVREVDNIKNQIVVYGSGLSEGFQWPAETLTEGRGRCGDTTILMASILVAGNDHAHYEMNVFVWYLDSDNMASPGIANHAIIGIQFSDGSYWALETTTNYFHNITEEFQGWKYDITKAG